MGSAIKIKLLKRLDAVAGRLAVSVLTPLHGTPAERPRRFLVIRPGGIGDAVLIIPALAALKERFPRAEITVLAERRNAAAFSLSGSCDRVLLYDRPADLLKAVRGRYDVVIDSEQWHRLSAVVARLTRAPISVGFATNERSRLFSHPIDYSHDHYEVESFFNLLAPLKITPPLGASIPFLHLPPEAVDRAGELLASCSGRRMVALFPGASIAERRWGAARFQRVAASLEQKGFCVVVIGGRDDAAEGEAIVAGTTGVNLAGKTSLVQTAAVVSRSAVLVSGDSGILHIAVGLGVPTVSLFGPGIEKKWAPRGEGHVVLSRRLSCSPCTRFGTTPPCPAGARCMKEITVPEVVTAVEALLSPVPKRRGGI